MILAGIVTPLVGVERARSLLASWHGNTGFLRVPALIALLLGLFVVNAVVPRPRVLEPQP
jgi:hypothetical protein